MQTQKTRQYNKKRKVKESKINSRSKNKKRRKKKTSASSCSKIASARALQFSSSMSSQFFSYNFKRFFNTGFTLSSEIPMLLIARKAFTTLGFGAIVYVRKVSNAAFKIFNKPTFQFIISNPNNKKNHTAQFSKTAIISTSYLFQLLLSCWSTHFYTFEPATNCRMVDKERLKFRQALAKLIQNITFWHIPTNYDFIVPSYHKEITNSRILESFLTYNNYYICMNISMTNLQHE